MIHNTYYKLKDRVKLHCFRAHTGIENNEEADMAAKRATEQKDEAHIRLQECPIKSLMKKKMFEIWQVSWDSAKTACFIYRFKESA